MVERAGKFIEESDLLAVLQKAGGCRGLVCNGGKPLVHTLVEKYQFDQNLPTSRALTSNNDTVIPRWAKLQGHLMFVFVDSQVVFICKSLCEVKTEVRRDNGTGSRRVRYGAHIARLPSPGGSQFKHLYFLCPLHLNQ